MNYNSPSDDPVGCHYVIIDIVINTALLQYYVWRVCRNTRYYNIVIKFVFSRIFEHNTSVQLRSRLILSYHIMIYPDIEWKTCSSQLRLLIIFLFKSDGQTLFYPTDFIRIRSFHNNFLYLFRIQIIIIISIGDLRREVLR